MDAGGDGRLVGHERDDAVADGRDGVRLGVGAAPGRLWTRDADDQRATATAPTTAAMTMASEGLMPSYAAAW